MIVEASITINANSQIIYDIYRDVANWHLWDYDIKESQLHGDFIEGTVGTLIPLKGPRASFNLTQVIVNERFTIWNKLPFSIMEFHHELIPEKNCTKVIHRIEFTGPLRKVFGHLIGKPLARGLPQTLSNLRKHIEIQLLHENS